MSMDLALSVARSGLRLLDRQMARTSDDIANAGTEGHTRKTLAGRALSSGGIGIGVRSSVPVRDVDLALQAAAARAGGDAAAGELRMRLLATVDAAHGRTGEGDSLGGRLSALRAAFATLREAPEDAIRRGAVVQAAQDLVTRFNTVATGIGAARQQAHDALGTEAAAANAALADIGAFSRSIRNELSAGRAAADLEDKRDLAIARLAQSIDIGVIRGGMGEVTVVARGGIILPQDGAAFSVAPAAVAPGAFHGAAGALPGLMLNGQDVTRLVAGGRLAAAAELRDLALPRMQAELDLAAAHVAARLDAQGLRLFTDDAGAVPDVTLPYAGSAMIGFSGAIRVNAAVIANSNLVRDGTHPVVAAPAGPDAFTPNPAGGPVGFGILLDRLLGFAFGREVAAGRPQPPIPAGGLGPDGTLVSTLSGLSTLEAHAGALVAAQSAACTAAEEGRGRAVALGELLGARLQQRSGVDVDREIAAMVELQNAYTVNARVIASVQAMWDALLGAVR